MTYESKRFILSLLGAIGGALLISWVITSNIEPLFSWSRTDLLLLCIALGVWIK
jgi:hypothetical protein